MVKSVIIYMGRHGLISLSFPFLKKRPDLSSFIKKMEKIWMSFYYREANKMTDSLTNYGRSNLKSYFVSNEYPQFVMDALILDRQCTRHSRPNYLSLCKA